MVCAIREWALCPIPVGYTIANGIAIRPISLAKPLI